MKPLVLYILDIIRNLIKEGKTQISIIINESRSKDILTFTVAEDSPGIKQNKECVRIELPLLEYQAKAAGGCLENETAKGHSASLTAKFCLSHPARQRLGDIAGILAIMIAAYPEIDFIYQHNTDKGSFSFSTRETKKLYNLERLNDAELLKSMGFSINQHLKEIEIADINA